MAYVWYGSHNSTWVNTINNVVRNTFDRSWRRQADCFLLVTRQAETLGGDEYVGNVALAVLYGHLETSGWIRRRVFILWLNRWHIDESTVRLNVGRFLIGHQFRCWLMIQTQHRSTSQRHKNIISLLNYLRSVVHLDHWVWSTCQCPYRYRSSCAPVSSPVVVWLVSSRSATILRKTCAVSPRRISSSVPTTILWVKSPFVRSRSPYYLMLSCWRLMVTRREWWPHRRRAFDHRWPIPLQPCRCRRRWSDRDAPCDGPSWSGRLKWVCWIGVTTVIICNEKMLINLS